MASRAFVLPFVPVAARAEKCYSAHGRMSGGNSGKTAMLDKLLENVDDLAGKLGLPADQVQNMVDSFQSKVGEGGDQISALMEMAQEHGLPMEKIQGMLSGLGIDVEGMLEIAGNLLEQGEEGAGGALGNLMGMAKGFLGK